MRGLKPTILTFINSKSLSHLLQMRGLKQPLDCYLGNQKVVASFTDAWIETSEVLTEHQKHLSHLLQMRGLKLNRSNVIRYTTKSHLLQMRGLKQGVVTNINIKTSRIFYRCVD